MRIFMFILCLGFATSASAVEPGTYSLGGNKSTQIKFTAKEWSDTAFLLKGCFFVYGNLCPGFSVVIEKSPTSPTKYLGDGTMTDTYTNGQSCIYPIRVEAFYNETKKSFNMSVYSPTTVSPQWNPSCPTTMSWYDVEHPFVNIGPL